MSVMSAGGYRARLARDGADVAAAQRLRFAAFHAARGLARPDGLDRDAYDTMCRHVLVEKRANGALVGCFRLLALVDGSEIHRSYSAQYYDLSPLCDYPGRMVEVGRFCIRPGCTDPGILRTALAELTRLVDAEGVAMLFGCSSFHGARAEAHADALAFLAQGYLAPRRWLPRVKAPDVFRFARMLGRRQPDRRKALCAMPPLLRSYLGLGGWVSDHAVVDRALDTIHVFTGLEIAAIPPARARLLRADAAV
ncbi:MAG: GNAT family N-acyltransferase [Paracoccaceae bacterium]